MLEEATSNIYQYLLTYHMFTQGKLQMHCII